MRRFDWLQLVSVLAILGMGLIVQKSVSQDLFPQQLTFAIISLMVYFLVSRIDHYAYSSLSWPLYFASIILLISPYLFGTHSRGSLRWIIVGPVYFQASEFARPLLLLSFAGFISRFPRPLSLRHILSLFALFTPAALLIFKQPDLGTTLVVSAGFVGAIIAGGIKPKYLILGLVILFISLPIGYNLLHDYQKSRIKVFFNPYSDPLGQGYNSIQSTIAVGSGRLLGRGLGQGTQSHLRFLPENHTDFIFASLAEELGFVGCLILLSAYFLLFWRLYQIAINSPTRFGTVLVLSILMGLEFQTLINIGMNIAIAPVTGITLPLVSYGGSSLLTTFILLGLVQGVAARSSIAIQSLVIK